MKYNHLFCSICEIVGEDRFYAGPQKSLYFLCKSFSYVLHKKSRNKLCVGPHDTYVLFRTFFSQINNKWLFFTAGGPLNRHALECNPWCNPCCDPVLPDGVLETKKNRKIRILITVFCQLYFNYLYAILNSSQMIRWFTSINLSLNLYCLLIYNMLSNVPRVSS